VQDDKRKQAALGPVKTYVLKKTFRILVFLKVLKVFTLYVFKFYIL